jgi:hypothetical protein
LETLFGVEVLPLEDQISRAVRRHVPDLIEKIGSLPDRLRLLGLSGEDRSRSVMADAADLLKGDAGGAAAALGGLECSLPDEINWARAVFDALENGAETDVRAARKVLDSLKSLESLFSGSSKDLCSKTDAGTVEEILASERFHERLPELRGLIRAVQDNAKNRYSSEHALYIEALAGARSSLESTYNWGRLVDEDREEIVARLTCDLPENVDEGDPVSSVQKIMVRRRSLPALVAELNEEVSRKVPREDEEPDEWKDGEGVEWETEEVLTSEDLIEPALIATSEQLDNWLSVLRSKLESLLGSKKRIRIKGRE